MIASGQDLKAAAHETADPMHERAVVLLVARVFLLCALAAAAIAIVWSRHAGADWPAAILRGEIAAVSVALLGLLAMGPLRHLLRALPKSEPEPGKPGAPEPKPGSAVPAPVAPGPGKTPQTGT